MNILFWDTLKKKFKAQKVEIVHLNILRESRFKTVNGCRKAHVFPSNCRINFIYFYVTKNVNICIIVQLIEATKNAQINQRMLKKTCIFLILKYIFSKWYSPRYYFQSEK